MELNRDFINGLRNIVKTAQGYELKPVNIEKDTLDNKCCYICIYHQSVERFIACDIRKKLEENSQPNTIFSAGNIWECDAFTPVYPLNIIKSEEEIIQFIEKTENFFGCVEEYEAYYGFERKWDEDTGEVLETVREYYNRGGKFENIPDKYPCVIYFSYTDLDNESYERLKWIYIGD